MTKRAFWLGIVASALALPATGCESGKSCKDLCEATNACPDVTDVKPCEQYCKDQETFLKASACAEKQQAYDECVSKVADICSPTSCVTEALTIYDCIDDYCMANPSACNGG